MKKKNESNAKSRAIFRQTIDVLYQTVVILGVIILVTLCFMPIMFNFPNITTVGQNNYDCSFIIIHYISDGGNCLY